MQTKKNETNSRKTTFEKARDKNFIMCIFRYAMSISSSLTHIFAVSLPPWLVSLLFRPVFMFYAAIKTTREQHNIIRYVLKILTKTELDALLWKPHWKSACRFRTKKIFFQFFSISAFAIPIQNNAPLSLLLIQNRPKIYSNKDKFRQ